MLYVVLTVLFLHILAVRLVVKGEFLFSSDDKTAVLSVKLFFIPVLKYSLDYDRIAEKVKSEDRSAEPAEKKKPFKVKGYLIRAGLAFLKRIEVRYIGLRGVLGTGDAASTALLCGGVSSALDGSCAVLGCQKYSEITPDYENMHINMDFGGIISFCLADIIYVAISAFGKGKTVRTEKPLAASRV